MKYVIALSMLFCSNLFSSDAVEIKAFSMNQKLVNECYYYETEDHNAEWYYKGKMDAYDEIVQMINRMSTSTIKQACEN